MYYEYYSVLCIISRISRSLWHRNVRSTYMLQSTMICWRRLIRLTHVYWKLLQLVSIYQPPYTMILISYLNKFHHDSGLMGLISLARVLSYLICRTVILSLCFWNVLNYEILLSLAEYVSIKQARLIDKIISVHRSNDFLLWARLWAERGRHHRDIHLTRCLRTLLATRAAHATELE